MVWRETGWGSRGVSRSKDGYRLYIQALEAQRAWSQDRQYMLSCHAGPQDSSTPASNSPRHAFTCCARRRLRLAVLPRPHAGPASCSPARSTHSRALALSAAPEVPSLQLPNASAATEVRPPGARCAVQSRSCALASRGIAHSPSARAAACVPVPSEVWAPAPSVRSSALALPSERATTKSSQSMPMGAAAAEDVASLLQGCSCACVELGH